MKKTEQIYREILFQAMEKGNRKMTQLELSQKLGVSLSTINLALKKLDKMGAIAIKKMNFAMINLKKILYCWASLRNLEKDVLWKVNIRMPVRDIERNMPDVFWGVYSAYKFRFHDVPADYSEVYVYADDETVKEIKKRFPEGKNRSENFNLCILKKDDNMKHYNKTTTIGQIFVDLWNIKQWYAHDFLKALEERLKDDN